MVHDEFEVIVNEIKESEYTPDLDTYLRQLVTTTDREESAGSQCVGSLLPSPQYSDVDLPLSDGNLIEPTGLVSVNENSVISHVGVTSGIHLVTQCERIDNEIWY
jgi:hypothetical protein